MPLTDRDSRAVQETADIAYTIPDRAGMFTAVCERLQKIFAFDGGVFVPINLRKNGFQLDGHAVFNSPSDTLPVFCAHYAPLHPLFDIGLRHRRFNEAMRITDVMADTRLQKTEYCGEFQPMIPMFFELDAMVSFGREPIGALCLHRTRREGDFTGREKQILSTLMPHLSRAFYSIDLVHGVGSQLNLGIIALGQDGKPHPINPAGRSALEANNGRMDLLEQSQAYTLRRLPLGLSESRHLILLEPRRTGDELVEKLNQAGLTPRQREIVSWVAKGLSNREIGDRLCITEQTVKDHIQAIFQKLNVRRRAELISILYRQG